MKNIINNPMIDLLTTKPHTSVKKFENSLIDVEKIPLILRCPSTSKIIEYSYQKAAPSSWSLKEFITKRIKPYSGDAEIEVRMPNGKRAHRRITLGNLRKAYTKEIA